MLEQIIYKVKRTKTNDALLQALIVESTHPTFDNISHVNIAMIAINQGNPFDRVVCFATTQILASELFC